jgi:hypothetical protein
MIPWVLQSHGKSPTKKMNNIEIDKKNKEVKLLVDTRFYGYGAVFQAAKDYLDSCWVLIDGDKENILLVTIKPKTEDIGLETVGFEFYNYMLGLIQNAIFSL